jgi:hypothetical protein
VEDDAELEDEEGSDLLSERLLACVLVILRIGPLFDELLFVGGGDLLVLDLKIATGYSVLDVGFGLDAILHLDVTLGTEVEEEDDYHGGEDDCWAPGVVRPSTGHADACLWANLSISWVEEVDECCCDDDAGAEVAGGVSGILLAQIRRVTHRAKR